MGGALLAHTLAGLLDGRRSLTHPPTSFAPLSPDANGRLLLRPFYRTVVEGRRVLLADDVRNTGETFARGEGRDRGGRRHRDRDRRDLRPARSVVDVGVPNFALTEYPAPENYPVANCPLCKAGVAVTRF